MDLAEIWRVMRRRWYVLLPGLLLTAALIAGAAAKVPVTYQSQSTVALLNSRKATVSFGGNPFLSTQTSLTGMADSLARNLNSDASVAALKAEGATGTSVAKIADNALGPLMWLTVTGTDKDAVLASGRLFTDYAQKRLDEFQTQQSVASDAMIRMTVIVPPQIPVAQTKTRLEYLVLAGLLGFVCSLVATFYVEARGRPQRRPAAEGDRAPSGNRRDRAGRGGTGGGTDSDADGGGGSGADGSDTDLADPDAQSAPQPVRTAPRWSAAAGDPDLTEPDAGVPAAGSGSEAHRFV